jgi:hypothetical protein
MDLSRATPPKIVPLAILTSVTLLLRILGASVPYYVDGPRHVDAIQSGQLVIQAPGYFLFNSCAWALSRGLHISAATALQVGNIGFSVAGVALFDLVASRLLKNPATAFALSLAYACSPVVWFAADIHSTYAAMTFFTPLLLLTLEGENRFVLGCSVWALMMGFRPSDGVFVLPWMIYQSLRFPWKQRITGAAAALAITALWWIPTARRYGGGLLSPLSHSHTQAARLAQGVLTGHLTIHALLNGIHTGLGAVLAWGLLTPVLILGVLRWARNPLARSMTIYIAPGLAFFLLYFFSDPLYLAYAIAPGMLLAGLFLEEVRPSLRQSTYAVAIAASLIFMLTARPSNEPSKMHAVADAYLLQYSVPSLKRAKTLRLAKLLGACHEEGVIKCQ